MRFQNTSGLINTCATLAVLTLSAAAQAGGDKIAFPENWAKGTLYSQVDRYDIKQYRELYASPGVVEAVKRGLPIPDNAVLTLAAYKAKVDAQGNPTKGANGRFEKGDLVAINVMEKRKGWGTEYGADIRNGEWEYQSFMPDKKVNDKANLKACFQCHKPHEKQDFVMSLASFTGGPAAAVAKRSGPGVVSISEFLFGPEKITVQKGRTIEWTNTDDSPHQVTVAQGTPSELRTDIILKGKTAGFRFDHAGTYNYICGFHPGMKGIIEVQ